MRHASVPEYCWKDHLVEDGPKGEGDWLDIATMSLMRNERLVLRREPPQFHKLSEPGFEPGTSAF